MLKGVVLYSTCGCSLFVSITFFIVKAPREALGSGLAAEQSPGVPLFDIKLAQCYRGIHQSSDRGIWEAPTMASPSDRGVETWSSRRQARQQRSAPIKERTVVENVL